MPATPRGVVPAGSDTGHSAAMRETILPPDAVEALPPGEYTLRYNLPGDLLDRIAQNPNLMRPALEQLAESYGDAVVYVGGGVTHYGDGVRALTLRIRVLEEAPPEVLAAGIPLAAIAWAIGAIALGVSAVLVTRNLDSIVVHAGELLEGASDGAIDDFAAGAKWGGVAFATIAAAFAWWVVTS